ncbi:UL10 [Human betaherpesvirus 5]|uniref:Membrane protein UL10 n=2 Tax=Human cytomegalovirus TaxID=10359 RepID=Q6SX97_HCMVO|nr:membrane protein UL10 [Human betaherpesvirus 5]AAS48927.1 UL10 [Human betaherpesvirus 5]AND81408.1 membrane protein UL10 [Human betaherpesvirus 5]AND81903.1 membrane protein UL10 [Human betaherpesvirus 5]APB97307.1 membrane protein UL10 [Human betaherpesvirus 5]
MRRLINHIVNHDLFRWSVVTAMIFYRYSETCMEVTVRVGDPVTLGSGHGYHPGQKVHWYNQSCVGIGNGENTHPICTYDPPKPGRQKTMKTTPLPSPLLYECHNSTLSILHVNVSDPKNYCRRKCPPKGNCEFPTCFTLSLISRTTTTRKPGQKTTLLRLKTTPNKHTQHKRSTRRTSPKDYNVTGLPKGFADSFTGNVEAHRTKDAAHSAWILIIIIIIIVVILFFFKIPQRLREKWDTRGYLYKGTDGLPTTDYLS